MSRKRNDAAKAKQKKQKTILIVLGVVLAGLLAFQLPKLMKKDKAASADAVATSTSADPTSTTTAPSSASPVPAPAAQLASQTGTIADDPDPAPVAQEGQLVGFGLFETKDPFVQQLGDGVPVSTPTGSQPAPPPGEVSPPVSTPPAGEPPVSEPPVSEPPVTEPPVSEPPASEPPVSEPPASEPPVSEPPVSEPPVSDPPASEPPASTTPATTTPEPASPAPAPAPVAPIGTPSGPAKLQSATISVNNVSEEIQIGAVFPKASPLFRLVSIEGDVAQIAISGGSLQDGAPTVPLTQGKPLTLMNTADGTRYVLRLLAAK